MISSKMNQSVQLPVGEHIRTPDIGKLLHFMVYGHHFLAETDPNPPTPNLSFNIPFHLYIHDLVLDEPIATLIGGVTTYIPLI